MGIPNTNVVSKQFSLLVVEKSLSNDRAFRGLNRVPPGQSEACLSSSEVRESQERVDTIAKQNVTNDGTKSRNSARMATPTYHPVFLGEPIVLPACSRVHANYSLCNLCLPTSLCASPNSGVGRVIFALQFEICNIGLAKK